MEGVCPECHGTGFRLRTRPDGVVLSVRCGCLQEARAERLLRAARIPRRYEHCTLESFEQHNRSHEAALAIARDWVDRYPLVRHGLLFLGPPGTGKTHLAVAMARELILRKSVRVLFYEQRELLKLLQGSFDAGAAYREAEVLGPVQEVDLLVLDDVGAGRTTPWAREVLHEIIGHRYNRETPMLMTSNRPAGNPPAKEGGASRSQPEGTTLMDRLGDALMSRLHEMCRIVHFEGKDFRRHILSARIDRA